MLDMYIFRFRCKNIIIIKKLYHYKERNDEFMINGLKSIRRERASLERDRVVMTSMMEDAKIAESIVEYDSEFFESVSSEEIEELITKIPESDDEDEQIEKILVSPNDGLDVDGILGVE